MARPTAFQRQTSFTQFSSNFPSKQQNGASLDAEFNAAKVALDETQSNLALIQDDDGRLARGSVGRAQFDSTINLGFESPTPWAADTTYTAFLSTVWYTGKFYTAVEDHTSTETFDDTKWFEVADLSFSASIDDGSITEAKLASSAVTADKIQSLAVTTPKIASAAVTTAKLADGAVTRDKVNDDAGPDLASLILPAGLGPIPWPSNTAPEGWVFDGATYNRADYPALAAFALAEAALGNTWFTVGDGSTTFGIKDAEGRAIVGVDTNGSTIGTAMAIGATTGTSAVNLPQSALPNVNQAVTISDPGHVHQTRSENGGAATGVDNIFGRPVASGGTGTNTDSATTGITASVRINGNVAQTPTLLIQPSIAVRYIFKAH